MFNGIAYCTCNIKQGKSISLSFNYDGDKDICTVNAQGVDNGYMMSTFSLPEEVKKGGNKALYTCPGGSTAKYAQCDGGTCFKSTIGQTFPGVGKLGPDEIICSCPITQAKPGTSTAGYQILGPYPCDKSFFKYCRSTVANGNTGSTIYVGAPIGTAAGLTVLLDGKAPPLNDCGSE